MFGAFSQGAPSQAGGTKTLTASSDLQMARRLVAREKYVDALAMYRVLLKRATPPEFSVEDTLAYATALSATGDMSGAQDAIQEGLRAAPESPVLNDALGSLLAQAGHMEDAAALFRKSVAADPGFARGSYHLGVALLASGHAEESVEPLRSASQALPESFDVQLQFGRALSATHADEDALKALHFAATLRKGAPPQALYELALGLQASGDPAAALPLFAEVTDAFFAKDEAALTNYALAKVQTGDAKGALPIYARALSAGPDSPTLREDYGAAYLQQAKLNEALEQFRAGLALEPDNAHLHYDVGLALKLKDDLVHAVPEFERAAELDPSLPDPAYTLGVIFMQQGKAPEATEQLRKATSLQPQNGQAWALLGNVLKDAGDPGATAALEHAIALDPGQPSLHVQLAAIYAQAGRTQDAAAERKTAADLSRAAVAQQRATFALRSGRALLEQGKLPEAEIQFNNAILADPSAAEPHELLAEAYSRQGNTASAAVERNTAQSLKRATAAQKIHEARP